MQKRRTPSYVTSMGRSQLHENGDEIILTRTFDRTPFEENCAEIRKEIGDGFIRDRKGAAQARRLFSIPVEEAVMLQTLNDPDWVEWWHTDSSAALARLIVRFPHWVVAEGGGLL